MTKTLPITKAREELTTLVANAAKKLDEYIITVNGTPAAILMSVAEFESWQETMDILADKELMEAIREGEAQIERGEVIDLEDLKKELKLDV